MNPRLFCRERAYGKALLLTYSFDPIFFEQVVLGDLWAGRASDILVLGDDDQILAAVQAASGQLLHLGTQYVLGSAAVGGAFHPKLFLRLGPADGIVMLGSGNVTSAGWGGNRELGASWMVGPDHADKGAWLHPLLDNVRTWCRDDLARAAVSRFQAVPWLAATPRAADAAAPVLHSAGVDPLAEQLARRWAGRRFDELKILTGSTDESGAFLRWAHGTFGITRATVVVTPSSASFVAAQLADLPLALRMVAAPPSSLMHAKFYWFAGPDGAAALMGSANCSAAAWTLAPKQRGNIETLAIYDRAQADEFSMALALFDAPSHLPADFLVPRAIQETVASAHAPAFRLTSLHWFSSTAEMQATIYPAPLESARVELALGERCVPMARAPGEATQWRCTLADGLVKSTVFAGVIVTVNDVMHTTPVRWVDDTEALTKARQPSRLTEPFKGFDDDAKPREQLAMLNEMHQVTIALFTDTAEFQDPEPARPRNRSARDGRAPAEPLAARDLLVHLSGQDTPARQAAPGRTESMSLSGILGILFRTDADETRVPQAAGDEELDEGQLPEDAPPPGTPVAPAKKARPPVRENYRKRLADQVHNLLKKLAAPEFTLRCTATQMVQAVSFPLAVALRGRRSGWVTDDDAEQWALKVFSILFCSGASRPDGLLRAVQKRYAQEQKEETFDAVIGNGTLWLVLVATLGGANWQGIGTEIDKALTIREVFASSLLLASANEERVGQLLGQIQIDNTRTVVTGIASEVDRLLTEIEGLLAPTWKHEIDRQIEDQITFHSGDWLWRGGERAGWAVCLAECQQHPDVHVPVRFKRMEIKVRSDFYLNVTQLCEGHPELAALTGQLRQLCSPAPVMTT